MNRWLEENGGELVGIFVCKKIGSFCTNKIPFIGDALVEAQEQYVKVPFLVGFFFPSIRVLFLASESGSS
jgi:hypothetical protein